MTGIDHLERAGRSLDATWDALYADLVTTSRGKVHGELLYRTMAGVDDILGSSALLIDAHRQACAAMVADTQMLMPRLVRLFGGQSFIAEFQVSRTFALSSHMANVTSLRPNEEFCRMARPK